MARARAAEHQRPRSKTALIEEATLGIAKLQEVSAAINDLSQEGFPYRDAAQSKAELAKVSAELDRIKKRLANPSN